MIFIYILFYKKEDLHTYRLMLLYYYTIKMMFITYFCIFIFSYVLRVVLIIPFCVCAFKCVAYLFMRTIFMDIYTILFVFKPKHKIIIIKHIILCNIIVYKCKKHTHTHAICYNVV